MKHVLIVISIFVFLSRFVNVFGQTNASLSATEEKQIQQLKEKIATKVAELREKNNKAISGSVSEIVSNTIKLKTDDDGEYLVKLDETLTKYYQIIGGQKKEIRGADIKKDSYVVVSGIINDKKIDANFIYIDQPYMVASGKIIEVNKSEFYLKVVTNDKDTLFLDIEDYTKRQIINIKTLSIEQTGFSKIKEGDAIHFVVKKTGNEKDNRYSAQKILIVPQEYFMK